MNRGRQRTQRVAGAAFMIGLAVTSSVGAEEKRPAVAKQGGQILGSFMTGGQIWSSAVHDRSAVRERICEAAAHGTEGINPSPTTNTVGAGFIPARILRVFPEAHPGTEVNATI